MEIKAKELEERIKEASVFFKEGKELLKKFEEFEDQLMKTFGTTIPHEIDLVMKTVEFIFKDTNIEPHPYAFSSSRTFEQIIEVINDKYQDPASIAYRQILGKASILVPLTIRKETNIDEILLKSTLNLKVPIFKSRYQGNQDCWDYTISNIDCIKAFDKLILVKLKGENPLFVKPILFKPIYDAYPHSIESDIFDRLIVDSTYNLFEYKLKRSGKFKIKFYDENNARLIAKALLGIEE